MKPLNQLLNIPPREQSGAGSQHRFEYQVSSIVSHLIQKYKNNENAIVYCEFHDDFSEFKLNDEDKNLIFYQVKTNEVNANWTINRLIKKDGQHSMIGAMFYNYYKFNDRCLSCFFISNITFEKEIMEWNQISKNDIEISDEMEVIFNKVKSCILLEFEQYEWFELVRYNTFFDNFIKNIHFYTSNIPLETHDTHVRGEFLELYSENMYSEKGIIRVISLIYDLVRKKSRLKVKYPVSNMEELEAQKGISSHIFDSLDLRRNSDSIVSKSDKLDLIIEEYIPHNQQMKKILINIWETHHKKVLDVNDYLYKDQISKFKDIRDDFIISQISNIEKKEYHVVYKELKILISEFINVNTITWKQSNLVLEVIYFEYFI